MDQWVETSRLPSSSRTPPSAEVLSRFEADLQYLASTELHPALRGSASLPGSAASSTSEAGAGSSSSAAVTGGSASGPHPHASLLGLVHAPALREAAAAAARGHQHFGGKVAELEALFGMLKADVEALFMQAGGACGGLHGSAPQLRRGSCIAGQGACGGAALVARVGAPCAAPRPPP